MSLAVLSLLSVGLTSVRRKLVHHPYERIMRSAPTRADGNAHFAAGRFAEALAVYQNPELAGDALAASNAAEACLQLGGTALPAAEAHALRALALEPAHLKSAGRLAQARARLGAVPAAHRGVAEFATADETERCVLHKMVADASAEWRALFYENH